MQSTQKLKNMNYFKNLQLTSSLKIITTESEETQKGVIGIWWILCTSTRSGKECEFQIQNLYFDNQRNIARVMEEKLRKGFEVNS